MSFFSRIFYKRVSSNSKVQLSRDFGCYPPQKLSDKLTSVPFDVVYMGYFGNLPFFFETVFRASKNNNHEVIYKEQISGLRELCRGIKSETSEVKKTLDDLCFFKRVVVKAILAFVFILITPLLLAYVALRFFRISLKSSLGKGSYGYFMPISKEKYDIIVQPYKIKKSKMKVEAVISHEHIHMLQHYARSKANGFGLYSTNLKEPELILDKEYIDNQYICYLFDSNELEARLHELVISYYKAYGRLPDSLPGFYQMFISATVMSELSDAIKAQEHFSIFDIDSFEIRDTVTGYQLNRVMLSICSPDFMFKFIREVLPVMYANLLGYYGDDEASLIFLRQIQGPTLYDRLYHGNPPCQIS